MGDGSTRTYSNITPALLDCVMQTSKNSNGTQYTQTGPNQWTATTNTAVGTVGLSLTYDPSQSTLTYVIQQEPWIVTDNEIWNGICTTIQGCGGSC